MYVEAFALYRSGYISYTPGSVKYGFGECFANAVSKGGKRGFFFFFGESDEYLWFVYDWHGLNGVDMVSIIINRSVDLLHCT